MGASADTPSYSQAAQLIEELRSIRRSIAQLERTLARQHSGNGPRHEDLVMGMLGSVALGLLAGLVVLLALSRIVPALTGS
jgi:hypothetical protein